VLCWQEHERLERELSRLRGLSAQQAQQLDERDEALRKHMHLAAMINRLTSGGEGAVLQLADGESLAGSPHR
jgi:hypothetical protein